MRKRMIGLVVLMCCTATLQARTGGVGDPDFNIVQPERWQKVESEFFTIGSTLPGRLGPDEFVLLEFEQRAKTTAPGSQGMEWVKIVSTPKRVREVWSGTEVSALSLTKRALTKFASNPAFQAQQQFIKDGGMQRWRFRISSKDGFSVSGWRLFYIVSPYALAADVAQQETGESEEGFKPSTQLPDNVQLKPVETPAATPTKPPRIILKTPRGPDPLANAPVMIEMLSPTAFETFINRSANFLIKAHTNKFSPVECCILEFQQSVMRENREFEWTTIMDIAIKMDRLEGQGYAIPAARFTSNSMERLGNDPAYESYRQMMRDGKSQHWRVRAYTGNGSYKSDWLRFKVLNTGGH